MWAIYFWIQDRVDTLRHNERGAAAVEYGLLVGLIAVAIIAAVLALGGKLDTLFDDVTAKLPGGAP
jgi:pilus assembly protein Flp/PilA